MSIGTIVLIILVIALLGGFSGIGGGPSFLSSGFCVRNSGGIAFSSWEIMASLSFTGMSMAEITCGPATCISGG